MLFSGFESFQLLVVARYQRWLFRRIGSNRKKALVMSSEAKIPQGWQIGLAVLALVARDVHPWSVFRHLLGNRGRLLVAIP